MFIQEDDNPNAESAAPQDGSIPAPEEKPEKPVKPAKPKKEAAAKEGKEGKPASLKKEKGKKGEQAEAQAASDEKSGGKKKKDKAGAGDIAIPAGYLPRLMTFYREQAVPQLMKRFNYSTVMMVPRLEKVVLNVGVGEASQNPKLLESSAQELGQITGRKASITRARKSISNFKLRKGMSIGCRVTLRRWVMYEFLDRFLNVAIPRIRDFRGLSDRSFDGRGSYTIGLKEQIIFPEIDIDKIERVHGMDITFVTTARTDEEAQALLQVMGVPFRKHSGEGRETTL
jgi:large subunit ribosomal protein L5